MTEGASRTTATASVRILHLEDNPGDSELAALHLEADGLAAHVERVETLAALQDALARGGWSLVLADYSVPGVDALEVLRWARREHPQVPFVFLSGAMGEETAVEAVRQGATDYVLKHRLERLAPAVRRALAEATDRRLREQAEADLRRNEERLRVVFENVALGIAEVDDHGRFLNVNGRLCELLGWRREELLGRTLYELTAPEDRARAQEWNEQIFGGALDRFDYEKRYLRRDGTPLWVHVTVSAVRDARGRLLRSIGTVEDISERRRAEEQVRHERELLGRLIDRLPVFVTIYDPRLRAFRFNEEFRRVLGWTEADAADGSLMAKVYPDPQVRAQAAGHMASLAPGWREFPVTTKDGAVIPTSWANLRLGDDTQVGIGLDLRERRRAEETLRRSEVRFRSVFEQAAIGMGTVRFDDARWTDVNEAFCRMLGRSREEMLRTPWPRMTHPDDVAADLVPFGRMARGELDSYSVEKRLLRPGGEPVWARLTLSLVRDAAGRPDYEIAIVEDIDDRKRSEEALRVSQSQLEAERARLQAIVDTIPVGFFVLDERGAMTLANDVMRRTWSDRLVPGRPLDYALFRGFWPESGRRLAPEEWPCVQALRGRRIDGAVIDIERLDGTRGTLVVSSAPIRDESGRVVGAVASHQDITELVEAQRKLEEADRRKNEFLAVLSHELRNPLTPIRNSLRILERARPGGEQARRGLVVIDRQVTQMARLVDDLLDVTRISRGKIRLQREHVDLRGLATRTAEDHRDLFEANGVELRIVADPQPLVARVDPVRAAQMIGNLLGNAAKFTPRGGLVELALLAQGGQAVVRVRDTGVGVPADVLPRLFEPFTQAEQTLDRTRGGLGLGLALVKGLAELHGGSVAAASAGPERGAEFTVRLPLETPGARPQEPRPARAAGARPLRVLVVEDNVDAAESLKEALELDGHAVETAFTGPEGLEKAKALRPEVVLCDLGLPGMDGFAVARAVRDEMRDPPYLVAVTGYALQEDVDRASEAGFQRHIAKPPSHEVLQEALAAAAGRGSVAE